MSELIISEAVQHGIKNTSSGKRFDKSKKYKQLVKEAIEMIRKDNIRYAEALERSKSYKAL